MTDLSSIPGFSDIVQGPPTPGANLAGALGLDEGVGFARGAAQMQGYTEAENALIQNLLGKAQDADYEFGSIGKGLLGGLFNLIGLPFGSPSLGGELFGKKDVSDERNLANVMIALSGMREQSEQQKRALRVESRLNQEKQKHELALQKTAQDAHMKALQKTFEQRLVERGVEVEHATKAATLAAFYDYTREVGLENVRMSGQMRLLAQNDNYRKAAAKAGYEHEMELADKEFNIKERAIEETVRAHKAGEKIAETEIASREKIAAQEVEGRTQAATAKIQADQADKAEEIQEQQNVEALTESAIKTRAFENLKAQGALDNTPGSSLVGPIMDFATDMQLTRGEGAGPAGVEAATTKLAKSLTPYIEQQVALDIPMDEAKRNILTQFDAIVAAATTFGEEASRGTPSLEGTLRAAKASDLTTASGALLNRLGSAEVAGELETLTDSLYNNMFARKGALEAVTRRIALLQDLDRQRSTGFAGPSALETAGEASPHLRNALADMSKAISHLKPESTADELTDISRDMFSRILSQDPQLASMIGGRTRHGNPADIVFLSKALNQSQ